MDPAVLAEIEDLRRMKAGALRAKYRELFGEESRSSNKQFLFRRIAWRLQARVEGDLSERARRRALEIADDADLRIRAPEGFSWHPAPPMPGSHRIGQDHEEMAGSRCPARCSPASLRTAGSSSRFWKTALNINLSGIVR